MMTASMGVEIPGWDQANPDEALQEGARRALSRAWARDHGLTDHIEVREVVQQHGRPVLRITWAETVNG